MLGGEWKGGAKRGGVKALMSGGVVEILYIQLKVMGE